MNAMRGVRFAPSPTGAFHLGNFRTAWVSHAWARALGEPWVVRFEDIDAPRSVPGARERQLDEMAELGLVPDEVRVQSEALARHREVFARAVADGGAYPCFCSRKEVRDALAGMASAPHEAWGSGGAIYSGHCRDQGRTESATHAPVGWRFRMPEPSGAQDFLIARARPDGGDFAPAYQWACAVDDCDGHYRLLVRAWDLESSLAQQRAIQKWLAPGDAPPAVFHAALVVDEKGHRLEKRAVSMTWPELRRAGVAPEKLTRAFEASYGANFRAFEPGASFGETRGGEALRQLRASEVLAYLAK